MSLIKYKHNKKNVITIIKNKSIFDKNYFLTEKSQPFQVGMLSFEKFAKVQPHYQIKKKRVINRTCKFIFLKKGELRLKVYYKKKKIKSFLIKKGDMVLIDNISIGIDFLKPSFLVEIKQGPYNKNFDKIKFYET